MSFVNALFLIDELESNSTLSNGTFFIQRLCKKFVNKQFSNATINIMITFTLFFVPYRFQLY